MIPVIFGIRKTEINKKEKDLFIKYKPAGFILFKNACKNKEQIKNLTRNLREIMNDPNLPILIDQEGGRVRRLKGGDYWEAKNSEFFGNIYNINKKDALELVYYNYYLIGLDLYDLGINYNCAPVLDLKYDITHDVIGDRSFGRDPKFVTELSASALKGLEASGVYGILKHIPGHGLATTDSHHDLPVVSKSIDYLLENDFKPFMNLNNVKWAMTAHIIFNELDPKNSVTTSKEAINFIREKLGFKENIIISDAIDMAALSGTLGERAKSTIDAGCDIVLQCSGKFKDMLEVSETLKNYEINAEKLYENNIIENRIDLSRDEAINKYNLIANKYLDINSKNPSYQYSEVDINLGLKTSDIEENRHNQKNTGQI